MDPTLPYSRIMADFGPNATAVAGFLERIRDVNEGDALALAAAWEAADAQRRRSAWRAARHAARSAGRTGALEAAQSAIMTWSNAWSPIAAYGNPGAGAGQMRAQIMRGAVPALVDAVCALVVGGLIDGADFEALYGPWRSVDEEAGVTAPPR